MFSLGDNGSGQDRRGVGGMALTLVRWRIEMNPPTGGRGGCPGRVSVFVAGGDARGDFELAWAQLEPSIPVWWESVGVLGVDSGTGASSTRTPPL